MGWEPIPKLIHTSFPDQGLTSHVPISHLLPFADSGFQVRLFFKGSSFCMRLFKNIHIGLLPPHLNHSLVPGHFCLKQVASVMTF